ncbi:hypothetical protein BJY04DRAFT_17532 [Aspergillus karnatakaensis]|uniref:putative arsenite efflux transporter ArsB-like n=1 Tax=Aspergillus karnatakaensis TaxID=1810916 RepID=UPI003CCCD4FD
MEQDLDTDRIKDWRSIITLIVFVLANIVVLFPFHVPIYIPRSLSDAVLRTFSSLRVIEPRQHDPQNGRFVRINFPFNFVTAPLIADLFLLAILAIGRKEVHDGTIEADNISPYDIMVFFITLAYIAISIDASGLIRWLAFKVLQKGGKSGHRLFFYLYAFFFILGSFIGNDPIILSGTAFLAYMTRVSSNIVHPRAWIYTQFSIANIASAILVTSNPTNLVLTSAFQIKFIDYTANVIVPVVITAIVLFPFLLYVIFADKSLVPSAIEMHELPEEVRAKKPVNPNIPYARGIAEEQEKEAASGKEGELLSLEEILNPFLDKPGALVGGVIMAATLITVLAINAASGGHSNPVFWVTLPAAFVHACWDLGYGWVHRRETREIARKGKEEVERIRAERAATDEEMDGVLQNPPTASPPSAIANNDGRSPEPERSPNDISNPGEKQDLSLPNANSLPSSLVQSRRAADEEKGEPFPNLASQDKSTQAQQRKTTLESLALQTYQWLQETFPTATTVVSHMPFPLVPFAFAMFVLVQALVTKGWIEVFAYGWDHWVNRTGTVGAIGGMGFLSVILCNFAGTNIGTTILLSRVVQTWQEIHRANGIPISDRTFWATVYSMAIGVNYGAFSTAFSASLAGLLWRDILARKHIHVRSLDFAVVNAPIIAISMVVGLAVLIGEVYVMRDTTPYDL